VFTSSTAVPSGVSTTPNASSAIATLSVETARAADQAVERVLGGR